MERLNVWVVRKFTHPYPRSCNLRLVRSNKMLAIFSWRMCKSCGHHFSATLRFAPRSFYQGKMNCLSNLSGGVKFVETRRKDTHFIKRVKTPCRSSGAYGQGAALAHPPSPPPPPRRNSMYLKFLIFC